jgi:hypothetical protein
VFAGAVRGALPDEFEFVGREAEFELEAAVLLVDVLAVVPVTPLSDLMYATSATSCSSVTCPLNVGMIG